MKKREKWDTRSPYNFCTQAHHLNINSRPLCERLVGITPAYASSCTDNPANVSCRICLLGWDAIQMAGLKLKWVISMWDGTEYHNVASVHHATLAYHLDKVLKEMGGITNFIQMFAPETGGKQDVDMGTYYWKTPHGSAYWSKADGFHSIGGVQLDRLPSIK